MNLRKVIGWPLGAGILFAATIFAAPEQSAKTLTGCLTKSAVPGQYVLTQEATGQKTMVRGSADLEKHSTNHKVKLTGDMAAAPASNLFEVSAVEMISESCESAKK
ncbi:MAG: hypothetical protein R2729_18415 [Bryobacteraceae bacterium]